jgi:16S rRNA (cytidine1402-2'-O)-methyltransferase
MDHLRSGADLALVTDAGTPAISDPGIDIVKAAIEKGIRVVPVPGASALVAALTVSGLRTDMFTFIGFLPRKKGMCDRKLTELMAGEPTVVVYESSRRLVKLLEAISGIDPDRQVVVARELTKVFEEVKRGTAPELAGYYTENEPAGEVVLMIAGDGKGGGGSLEEAVVLARKLMERESMKPSAAAKEAARQTGVSKGEIYKELV